MRILHVSDVHCSETMLKRLLRRVPDSWYDLLAVTGDLECDGGIINILLNISRPVFFVPGNMDDVGIVKIADEAGINIDARVIEHSGYYLVGIGGLSTMSSLNTVKRKLKEEDIDGGKLIVLAHHPPRASKVDRVGHGLNAGLRELREFIEEYQPLLYLHGHIHESPGSEKIGNTLVVNAGPLLRGHYAIVSINPLEARHYVLD